MQWLLVTRQSISPSSDRLLTERSTLEKSSVHNIIYCGIYNQTIFFLDIYNHTFYLRKYSIHHQDLQHTVKLLFY